MNENIVFARMEKASKVINSSKKFTVISVHAPPYCLQIKVGNNNNEITNAAELHDFINSLHKNKLFDVPEIADFDKLMNDLYVNISIVFPDRDVIINLLEKGELKCENHYLISK
jgi:hypothetical protein